MAARPPAQRPSHEQPIPLTPEDLLDPELGDEFPERTAFQYSPAAGQPPERALRVPRRRAGGRRHEDLLGIPGLANPAPDIAVIPGVRQKDDPDRGSFDVVKEGARPSLIIEVVSALDSEVRRNDYEKKVEIYRRAGVPEYLILDPLTSATKGLLLLTGYRLSNDGRYRRIEPDSEGRLLSETTALRFGVEEDRKTLAILNDHTGERLSSQAEARARTAEAEVARLHAELAQLRKKEAE
jgi:Uma2 family endonuclease